ncbi:MAG: PAS domain-containing protein [Verrucomicrobiaceae bacterium]|nr:PAS domain-containing protein [Verrucomicrobiaceae bacterium]
MNWMTVIWPMMIAACLTLALINLRIAMGDVRRLPHVFFFFSALAVAAVTAMELAILRAQTVEEVNLWLRWSSVPLVVMVSCVTGFVGSFFRTGKAWLAVSGNCLMASAEAANFLSDTPAVRHATGLQQVETFGGVWFTKPDVVEGPWSPVEIAGVALVIGFVLEASRTLWRAGGQKRAVIVGGSIAFFFLFSRGHAIMVERGIVQTPYFVGFAFLAVLVAMGHELSDEVFRAAQLSRDLSESERRMDLAAHAAKLGFWTWDLKSDEIWANETARELFEVPANEKVDFSRFMLAVHPEDRDGVQKAVEEALAGGLAYEREYRTMLNHAGNRWIAARGRVELGPGGKPVLMRGVLMDITAQKQSEYELQQLRGQLAHAGRVSMMGQLASALAHELNQPLGAILRNAEAAELFMQADVPNLEEVRAIIADIRKDDQRAGDVIDRLRALLKRRDIESRSVSVVQLLDEVLALIRADAAARGVKLTVSCDSDIPSVRGDRVHLQQVLINLIINAMDALSDTCTPERKVTVSADASKTGFVEVTVSDNGQGIPPEKLQNVFDPFFTTKPHGMGMGLPISRTIIEAHGGKITAGNHKNGGAVFRFTLPVDEQQEV